ncbi:MAG TPA: carbohydrate-binding protein, partial [Opitutaceae bacterium]|nr:carbohydrate-binding protein [Opitutaceae bacterium]
GSIHFAWVGDLNGDGNPDYLIDRNTTNPQTIEAYTHNGTFLWEVNFGPNSANQDNISPGSATIDVGHNDGVTVYDVNGDGRAEVIIKIANGVRFGNGVTFSNSNNNNQFIGVLNGATGALLASAAVPNDFLSVGPLSGWLGVGNCGIVFFGQNRNASGSFNQQHYCYTWNGSSSLTLKWKVNNNSARGHQMRIVDVNRDGTDDMAHLGFALSGVNGAVLYTLAGVNHGDRYHIADMDPARAGLEGYGIQQDNPNGLHEYYYDAANGTFFWKHSGAVTDVGRGDAGDLDGTQPGWEVFSFDGVHNARTNVMLAQPANSPWPSLRLWWDANDLADSYNDGKIEKFVPNAGTSGRWVTVMTRITDYASDAVTEDRGAPLFYGDILGDWREEVVVGNSANNKLYILTPPGTSNTRPTLRNDRYYRNCLSIKGYMQSHHVSFYLGADAPPPASDTYQAESATAAGGVTFDTNNSGFNGTAFANFPATGGSLTFNNIDGNGGGTKSLAIRYANGNAAARTGTIRVNGGTATSITFASTGGWTNWTTLNVNITLNNNGTNSIVFASTGNDLGNIDEITVP